MLTKLKTWLANDKSATVYIPRLWQIIITCMLIGVLVIAWAGDGCYFGGSNTTDLINAALYGYDASTIRDYFTYYSVNEIIPIFVIIIEYVAFIFCMVFLWKDQPRKAFCFSLLFLAFPIVFLLSVKNYSVEGYGTSYRSIGLNGYVFIILSLAAVVISFVMTRKVKEGARPVRQVAVVSAPDSRPSASDELMKLKELLDKGIITQEEYEAKRNDLVSKL